MAKITITLNDETGKLEINTEELNLLEILGLMDLAKESVMSGDFSPDYLINEEEIAQQQIKSKGNA